MSLRTMYPAQNNSPKTYLVEAISASDTSMTLVDASVLPEAPNLLVIGINDNAEIIQYSAITGNVVSGLIRGVNGTIPQPWEIDSIVARNWTAQDAEAFRENILDLEARKANTDDLGDLAMKDAVSWGEITGTLSNQTDLKTALDAKAPLASPALTGNPTAPTQAAGNSSTRIATTAFVRGELNKEILYFSQQAVSAASSAQIMRIPASGTNSAITTDTVVLECTFANSAAITSDITWTSAAGYITFSGTCTAATTANVTLGLAGNI